MFTGLGSRLARQQACAPVEMRQIRGANGPDIVVRRDAVATDCDPGIVRLRLRLHDGRPGFGGESVPCSEAMRFADQDGLPTGAHDAKCKVWTWLDTEYDVAFRISRTDLDRWLASDYPSTQLESDYCSPD